MSFCQIQGRKGEEKGRGVAALHKKDLKVKVNSKTPIFKSFECMEVTLQTNTELLRLTNIYRPGYSKKHQYNAADFLSDFEEYLCSMITKPGETIFMGILIFIFRNPMIHMLYV